MRDVLTQGLYGALLTCSRLSSKQSHSDRCLSIPDDHINGPRYVSDRSRSPRAPTCRVGDMRAFMHGDSGQILEIRLH